MIVEKIPFKDLLEKAKNPNTPINDLRILANHFSLTIKVAVSLNPVIPHDLKERLGKSLGKLKAYELYHVNSSK